MENVDGSPLTDLAAYRVHIGSASRNYNQQITLSDPLTTEYFVPLAPGEYYVAMTALDLQGNESAYSNEVLKTVY